MSDGRRPVAAELLQRSEAWGLTRLWLGAGPRPQPGLAEHVVWLDGADPALAARSGDMVLLYHLLWELTHVVFEHPGLLEDEPACTDEVCITCSDEGRVAEVEAVRDRAQRRSLVGGLTETVDVSLVDPVAAGRPGAGPRRRGAQHAAQGRQAGRRGHSVTSEPTGFLYPFIDAEERDASQPGRRSGRLGPGQDGESRACGPPPSTGAAAPSPRRAGPWRTASRGAAGSSPSATAAAPPMPKGRSSCSATRRTGRPLPAMSLVDDRAVLTALANDVGFELVFSRQIIAHARPGDIAVGFSTSGGSVNVLGAFEEAAGEAAPHGRAVRLRGRRDGQSDAVDHCLVVRSDSVHRIQEAQDALILQLWSIVQQCLEEDCRRWTAVTDTAPEGRALPAGRRPSSVGSRPSAGAGPACSTKSSRSPTARAARHRRRCSTPSSCPPSPPARLATQTDAAVLDAARPASGWPSAPTPSSSSRSGSPAGLPVTWRCTAP